MILEALKGVGFREQSRVNSILAQATQKVSMQGCTDVRFKEQLRVSGAVHAGAG